MALIVVAGPAGVLLQDAAVTSTSTGVTLEAIAGVLLQDAVVVTSDDLYAIAGVLLQDSATVAEPVVLEAIAGVLLQSAANVAQLILIVAGVLLQDAAVTQTGGVYGQTESITSFPTSEPNEEDDIPTEWHHG